MSAAESVQVYVVNRRSRTDRRAAMESQLRWSECKTYFTSDWDGPFDWENISSDDLSRISLVDWKVDSDNPWWSRPLKMGEIACSLSHDACWRHFLNTTGDLALILEDDTLLPPRIDLVVGRLAVRLPSGWGLCYLGRYRLDADEPYVDGLVKPGYSHCTFAYMLSRTGAQALVESNIQQMMMPVDEFIPAHYVRHPREDVATLIDVRIEAFAVASDAVHQRDKSEAGSDTEESPFTE